MKVLITGATGLIGSALSARLLKDQHTVVRLRRGGANYQPGDAAWDPNTGTIDRFRTHARRDNPIFLASGERLIEGMRLAGVPEG